MQIAKVVGHVVSTQKDAKLIGYKLLTVVPMIQNGVFGDAVSVAVDVVGAGTGEVVLIATGSAARCALDKQAPVDLAIVGILDTTEIDWFPSP